MSVFAILPVKGLAAAKQRLAHELGPGHRQALVEAMLCDVLVALRRSQAIDHVLVLSGDRTAQQIAASYGMEVVDEEDRGHNAAARQGIEHALAAGATRVLLVPGDCPLLDAAELDALVKWPAGARSALVVPDRHGTGTNALLLTPPDALEPAFGPGSCERHTAAAAAQEAEVKVMTVPTLALDIDTPEDITALEQEFATRHGGAARTRGALGQLRRSLGG
ncbi:MAG: 2-phospho-L-lactate guanylyltransferase [Actinomycetota bacterium]|nr:2-phospho-L-lactate guanylyltransferase [Actinomycetota bacterium]